MLKVILVNYASPDQCTICIDSLLLHGICTEEQIVIVDNASPDDSGTLLAKRFPRITTLLTGINSGYSGGINRGIQVAGKADFFLILNPDTNFEDNRIDLAIQAFENTSDLGVLGLNLFYPNGKPQYSARRFYSLFSILLRRTPLKKIFPFNWLDARHLMKNAWNGDRFDVDWVLGTGFMVRARALQEIGGMDEGYFLYMEDVDLCARMWLSGWRVQAIPSVHLIHLHQRASDSGFFKPALRIHLTSLKRFARKFGLPLFCSPRRSRMADRLKQFRGSE